MTRWGLWCAALLLVAHAVLATDTPTETPTDTETPTVTDTPTDTPTPVDTPTSTPTFTPTVTPPEETGPFVFAPTGTRTRTPTRSPTWTPSPTFVPTLPDGFPGGFVFFPTRTASITMTPTSASTPLPTSTATRTPALRCATFTPSPRLRCASFTPTVPTPTPIRIVQYGPGAPTATPACQTVELVGLVLAADGMPARHRRITFETRPSEVIDACVIRPSLRTVFTTQDGLVPDHTLLIGGERVLITIENGVASEVIIPRFGPVHIEPLMQFPTPIPILPPVPNLVIANIGQFDLLGVIPFGYGVLELTPGAVRSFTLTQDGDARGHRIRLLGDATAIGDALSVGLPAGGDVTGTYPNITLLHPILRGSITTEASPPALATGACSVYDFTLPGASPGMVAMTSPETDPGATLTWSASIQSQDMVQVQVCALTGMTPTQTTFQVRIVQ